MRGEKLVFLINVMIHPLITGSLSSWSLVIGSNVNVKYASRPWPRAVRHVDKSINRSFANDLIIYDAWRGFFALQFVDLLSKFRVRVCGTFLSTRLLLICFCLCVCSWLRRNLYGRDVGEKAWLSLGRNFVDNKFSSVWMLDFGLQCILR